MRFVSRRRARARDRDRDRVTERQSVREREIQREITLRKRHMDSDRGTHATTSKTSTK